MVKYLCDEMLHLISMFIILKPDLIKAFLFSSILCYLPHVKKTTTTTTVEWTDFPEASKTLSKNGE